MDELTKKEIELTVRDVESALRFYGDRLMNAESLKRILLKLYNLLDEENKKVKVEGRQRVREK